MNLLKRHKGLAIVGSLALILLIIIFVIISKMLFSTSKSEYGDRLNNIVEIKKATLDEVKESLVAMDEVSTASVRVQGKIVYTTIHVTKATSKDKAKEIASKTLEKYSEDVIGCYDFEFLISQEEELDEEGNNKSYNIAGNKIPDKEKINWTRN